MAKPRDLLPEEVIIKNPTGQLLDDEVKVLGPATPKRRLDEGQPGAPLQPKWEQFCLEYLKDFNIREAYERAGYAADSKSACYELFHNPAIQRRLQELQNIARKRFLVDIADIRDRLMAAAESAEDNGQYSAAIRAYELIGKHLGMFVEKSETELKIKSANPDEVRADIERLLKVVNVSPSKSLDSDTEVS